MRATYETHDYDTPAMETRTFHAIVFWTAMSSIAWVAVGLSVFMLT